MYMEKKYFSSLFLLLVTCHGWSVNVKVLREWRSSAHVCVCQLHSHCKCAFRCCIEKKLPFFDGRPLSNDREYIFATRHGLPRACGSKDDWTPAFLKARSPHFRQAGKNFPQATKSDIMYLGGVTLNIHAKATTPVHAKLKHRVSRRSRRCRIFFQHILHGLAKVSAYLSTVTKSRTIVEKSKFSSCGPKSGCEALHESMQRFLVDKVPNYPEKYELLNKKSTAPETEQRKHPPTTTTTTTQGQRGSKHTLARLLPWLDLRGRFFRNNRRPRGQQTTSVAHSNRNSLKPRRYWSRKASDSRRSALKTRCQWFKFLNVARETNFEARSRTQLSMSGRPIGITAVPMPLRRTNDEDDDALRIVAEFIYTMMSAPFLEICTSVLRLDVCFVVLALARSVAFRWKTVETVTSWHLWLDNTACPLHC